MMFIDSNGEHVCRLESNIIGKWLARGQLLGPALIFPTAYGDES